MMFISIHDYLHLPSVSQAGSQPNDVHLYTWLPASSICRSGWFPTTWCSSLYMTTGIFHLKVRLVTNHIMTISIHDYLHLPSVGQAGSQPHDVHLYTWLPASFICRSGWLPTTWWLSLYMTTCIFHLKVRLVTNHTMTISLHDYLHLPSVGQAGYQPHDDYLYKWLPASSICRSGWFPTTWWLSLYMTTCIFHL